MARMLKPAMAQGKNLGMLGPAGAVIVTGLGGEEE